MNMSNVNLLEQVKKYWQIRKQENLNAKKLERFGYALEALDNERINEFLEDGISIQSYEKVGSALRKVLDGYERQVFNILDNYRKMLERKDSEFFSELLRMNEDDLPSELREKIEPLNKIIIHLLETLYMNGADINHHTRLEYSAYDEEGNVLHECRSVMEYLVDAYSYSKYGGLIDWILAKEELELDPQIINQVLYLDNYDSIELLDRLLNKGIKRETDDLSGINVSSLYEVISHKNLAYRQEKFNVIWKHSSKKERQEIQRICQIDDLIIPNDEPSYSDENHPTKKI